MTPVPATNYTVEATEVATLCIESEVRLSKSQAMESVVGRGQLTLRNMRMHGDAMAHWMRSKTDVNAGAKGANDGIRFARWASSLRERALRPRGYQPTVAHN